MPPSSRTSIRRAGVFCGGACRPLSALAFPRTRCTFPYTSRQRPIWEARTIDISLIRFSPCPSLAMHANASAIAGALASVAHDAVMTPLDVLKQRMQLGLYPRPYVAFRSILKNEGFGALYASYFTTILMNIPNAAVLVVTNDWMKSILNPSGKQVSVVHRSSPVEFLRFPRQRSRCWSAVRFCHLSFRCHQNAHPDAGWRQRRCAEEVHRLLADVQADGGKSLCARMRCRRRRASALFSWACPLASCSRRLLPRSAGRCTRRSSGC